jgi:hypothetical protein
MRVCAPAFESAKENIFSPVITSPLSTAMSDFSKLLCVQMIMQNAEYNRRDHEILSALDEEEHIHLRIFIEIAEFSSGTFQEALRI